MKTSEIAYAGLISAFSIVVLWAGSMIPVNRIAVSAISAFALEFLYRYQGKRAGVFSFFAVSVFAFLLLPLKSIAILYLFYFGGYITLRQFLKPLRKWPKTILKFAYLNASTYCLYLIGTLFFSDLFGKIFTAAVWQILLGIFVLQFVWVLIDRLLDISMVIIVKYMRARGIKV